MSDALFNVVDFSTHLSGPLAAHLLRAAGADVVRVEHPRHGDGNRGSGPFIAGTGNIHAAFGGGVRSVSASNRSPRWPELVKAASEWADVVIVGGRTTDLHARGLGFPTIKSYNPRIVYCQITGYGLEGPWADRPAHGQNVDAVAGGVVPVREGAMLVTPRGMRTAGTPLAGVFAAVGTLAALLRRGPDGPGAFVHSSLWQSAMWWAWRDLNMIANEGTRWHDYQDMGSRYAIYETSDGRGLLVCPVERKFWQAFCQIIDMPEQARDRGDWSQGMEWGFDDEREPIAARLRSRSAAEWSELFERAAVPFSPILSLEEALDSDHARAVHVMMPSEVDGQPISVVAPPWQQAESPQTVLPPSAPGPPRLGEHSDEVLAEWGLTHVDHADLVGG